MIATPTRDPLETRAASEKSGVLVLGGPPREIDLDPVCIDSPPLAQLARLSTRSLFGYVGDPTPRSWRPTTPLADLAAMVPSIYNAGVGASGRSIVVVLRPDVSWDTTPPRAVTAHDVVRGIKRMGNPVRRPAALPYFVRSIRGMAEFCAGFASAVPRERATAEDLAAYQNQHEIDGVFALDDESLVFELTRPALDLPHLLALPCAAPAPIEYDALLPGSSELRRHLRSTGPYRPVQGPTDAWIRWEPNPVWQSANDPLRDRHAAGIRLVSGPARPDDLRRELVTGRIDLAWGVSVRDPSPPPARGFWALDHVALNARGPGALRELSARRVIADAIDAAARREMAEAAMAAEPSHIASPACSLVPPDAPGELREPREDARSADAPGRAAPRDPGAEKTSLVLMHPGTGVGRSLAKIITTALARTGIPVRCVELQAEGEGRVRFDIDRSAWDLLVATHVPEWADAGGRVHVELLAAGCPAAERAVDAALDCVAEPKRAAELWREAERQVLDDATVIPLLFRAPTGRPAASPRVENVLTLPTLADEVDLAALRISEDA